MSAFVLDASVAGRWLLSREPASRLGEMRLTALQDGVAVPALFRFESAHMLTRWARNADLDDAVAAAAELALLPTVEDVEPAAVDALLSLALETGLSAYDAAYLELAERLGLPLATVDGKLAAAARARGIAVIP